MPAGGDCLEGKREAKVQVSTECDAGRQERLALLGGKKLLVAANQNPGELVMVPIRLVDNLVKTSCVRWS